jgi:hypothetical protein
MKPSRIISFVWGCLCIVLALVPASPVVGELTNLIAASVLMVLGIIGISISVLKDPKK